MTPLKNSIIKELKKEADTVLAFSDNDPEAFSRSVHEKIEIVEHETIQLIMDSRNPRNLKKYQKFASEQIYFLEYIQEKLLEKFSHEKAEDNVSNREYMTLVNLQRAVSYFRGNSILAQATLLALEGEKDIGKSLNYQQRANAHEKVSLFFEHVEKNQDIITEYTTSLLHTMKHIGGHDQGALKELQATAQEKAYFAQVAQELLVSQILARNTEAKERKNQEKILGRLSEYQSLAQSFESKATGLMAIHNLNQEFEKIINPPTILERVRNSIMNMRKIAQPMQKISF